MGDSVPSDALFMTAFAEARVSANNLARYYLRALELQIKEEKEPSYVPDNEETVITLEHVLPENPQGDGLLSIRKPCSVLQEVRELGSPEGQRQFQDWERPLC
ncbi:MAG: hypothetical protein WKF55_08190 [Gemmatimonadaceae bacterium]